MNCDLLFVGRKLICLCAMLMKFTEILVSQSLRSQGASEDGSSSARSFDPAHPGVAPPLTVLLLKILLLEFL